MIDPMYLQQVAQDISDRTEKVLLNGQEVSILSKKVENTAFFLKTGNISGVTRIESLELRDNAGKSIQKKQSDINVPSEEVLEFKFEIEVREGEST
ncbi:hypothetical protein [Bacillus sp. FJAT-45350]|uniref:hypothetical protein n=1 Tax=Bacillus sp. FJAT-45350 TaxID=2011014 RepID=UPI000BB8C59C|nr:hypothetical protein [Bacillus sp. FJAT-45350]